MSPDYTILYFNGSMRTHAELKKKMLARPRTRAAYKALAQEFEALDELLKARLKAGLTQAQVAQRMGTHAPAVARLEASLTREGHSPTVATLRKYAAAVGRRLEIRLV